MSNLNNQVYIRPEMAARQERLVALTPGEVGWFGVVAEMNGFLVVEDIIVPKQTVSPSEVDYDSDALHMILEEHADVVDKIKFFGHSHYRGGVFFSTKDHNEFIKPLTDMGSLDYFICHVRNQKGEHNTRLDIFKPIPVDVEVELVTLIPGGVDTWTKEQLEENVKLKKYGVQRATAHKSGGQKTWIHVSSVADVKDKGNYVVIKDGARMEFVDGKHQRTEYSYGSRSIQRSDAKRAEGKGKAATELEALEAAERNRTQSQKGVKKEEQKQNEESKPKLLPSKSESTVQGEESLPSIIDEEDEFVGEVEDDIDPDIAFALASMGFGDMAMYDW